MSRKIICVCGPTASGKTDLGVFLAGELGGEVVSADSMQVYRGMDVGTAKPGPGEMKGIPHHMIDVWDPREDHSVAQYAAQALECMEGIFSRSAVPVVVGGTGYYFDSILYENGYAPAPDEKIRAELRSLLQERGKEYLYSMLLEEDPVSAGRLHPNDTKRVIRALEVKLGSGKTIGEHNAGNMDLPPRFDALMIGLDFENRQALYERTDRRVDAMFSAGLAEEVRQLTESGVSPERTAMQAIGYKETAGFLRGEKTLEETVREIKRNTRRYAKRQLTWFRKYRDMRWIVQPDEPDREAVRRAAAGYAADHGIASARGA